MGQSGSAMQLSATLLVLLHLSMHVVDEGQAVNPSCSCIRFTSTHGKERGIFSSPDYPLPYPRGICLLYTFIAAPHQIVELMFTDFDVYKGDPETCQNWLDRIMPITLMQPSYSPDIQQVAKRQEISPTSQLLTQWAQLNHKAEELFMLLYRMKHIPALRCLAPVVEKPFHRLLQKHDKALKDKHSLSSEGNVNRQKTQKVHGSESSIPLPVMLIEERPQLPTPSGVAVVTSQTESSNTDSTKNTSSSYGRFHPMDDEFLRNVSAIPMLSYDDLREATKNWSESNLLGKGGFGQVFKGEWKLLPVAVKRLSNNDAKNKELIREMCLNQYRHDNILPLYGYSLGGPEACLVYQLMGGGSLEQRLRVKTAHPPLSWSQRYRIAHGVARGLQYLHTMAGTPLIHGDIKPANILLDQCTMPKIGDFGLARKGPYGDDRTHLKVSRVHGTRPYLPDEYLRSRCLSPAVDVYSFGVVMVEMATALPAIDRTRSVLLLSDYILQLAREGIDFASLEDRRLSVIQNSNPQICRDFVAIGIRCTKYMRQERPTMFEVYKTLDAMELPGKHLT